MAGAKNKNTKAESKKEKSKSMIPDNLKESFAITTSKRDFGIYGERFLDVLTQAVKQEATGVCSSGIISIQALNDGSRILTFSMKRLMANDCDHNYTDAEHAMIKLEMSVRSYERDGIWKSRALITEPEIDTNQHIGRFRVPAEIWELAQNFSAGYRVFRPGVGFYLSSAVTYRLYKLIVGQQNPLTYHIDELREMLCLENKHKRLSDFQARVLDPAREQLKKCAEWYFDYDFKVSKEKQQHAKRGRPAYDLITFFPKFNAAVVNIQATADVYAKGDVTRILPDALYSELRHRYGFTDEEIRNSHIILEAYDIMAKNKESLLGFIQDSKEAIDRARGDKKALLLGYIKRHVKSAYNIPLGKDKQGDESQAFVPPNLFTDKATRGGEPSGIGDILYRK